MKDSMDCQLFGRVLAIGLMVAGITTSFYSVFLAAMTIAGTAISHAQRGMSNSFDWYLLGLWPVSTGIVFVFPGVYLWRNANVQNVVLILVLLVLLYLSLDPLGWVMWGLLWGHQS